MSHFRSRFHIPQHEGEEAIYFCGNSLGLQPKAAQEAIGAEMERWKTLGVEGWFEGEDPWLSYHRHCQPALAQLVGAQPAEVCPMNNLTVNIHLMLTSFYRPEGKRTKILTLAGDFPSDQYALETHLRSRGIDPTEAIIEVGPTDTTSFTVEVEHLLEQIVLHQDELALVMMSGLHYYTGQVLPMQRIAQQAQSLGIPVGFDLAHAIGNVPLHLHEWGVDFAVWCSYKYLNSGPGGVSGVFVHEKHHTAHLPRLAGWWGYREEQRFLMTKGFVPMQGAAGWQLSTPTILSLAVHRASLAIFEETSMAVLRTKSTFLTGYLAYLIEQINKDFGGPIHCMTPADPEARGCQLSLLVNTEGKALFEHLVRHKIIGDWREPNCIRMAPTPLYNSCEEVWYVGNTIRGFYESQNWPKG
jgi:kynureninase